MEKINNYLLFFLALSVPFLNTFKNFLIYLTFSNLAILLPIYCLIFLLISNTKPSAKGGKIRATLLLYFVAQSISAFLAFDMDLSMQRLIQEFQFLVVFLSINSMIINNESYENIFKGLLLGFGLSVAIAILQFMGVKQFFLFTQAELNGNAGLIKETAGNKVLRIWGPYGNSLGFSQYLATVGLILYAYFRAVKKQGPIAVLILLAAIGCIFLTVSRTATFCVVFTVIIIEYIYRSGKASKTSLYVLISVFVGVVALFLLLPGIQDNGNPLINRFSNAADDFKSGRLNLWRKGFEAFRHDIFFGVGPGNLFMALASEGFPMTSQLIAGYDGQHVENYYLTILYTYGLVGFFFFARLVYLLISYSYQLFILLRGRLKSMAYGGAMFGGVIVISICNITIPALVSEQRTKLLLILMIAVINNSFLAFNKVDFFKSNSLLRNVFTKS